MNKNNNNPILTTDPNSRNINHNVASAIVGSNNMRTDHTNMMVGKYER